jgi:hypothetical protein
MCTQDVWPTKRIRDGSAVALGFSNNARGIPTGMQDSEELPDDVPIADAVEQIRTPVEPVPDEESSAEAPDDVPLEAAPADWQEQREPVELDPENDEADRS